MKFRSPGSSVNGHNAAAGALSPILDPKPYCKNQLIPTADAMNDILFFAMIKA